MRTVHWSATVAVFGIVHGCSIARRPCPQLRTSIAARDPPLTRYVTGTSVTLKCA